METSFMPPKRKGPYSIQQEKTIFILTMKDKKEEQHKHNLVYAFQFGEWDRNYIGNRS